MVNVRLATACLATAAALLSMPAEGRPTTSARTAAQQRPPSDYPISRRLAPFQGLQGDELIAWAEEHRAGLRSKYASKLQDSAAHEEARRRRKRSETQAERRATATVGEVSLTNYQFDSTFYAPVTIGTPGQTVNLVLDTGSSDMWTVQGKENWNPGSSSTFANSTSAFKITYGSGEVSGVLAEDTVTLADQTASRQTFAIATSISQGLLGPAVEGIMGLGFPSLSTSKATPFWQAVRADEFSFYLRPSSAQSTVESAPGGTFTLGGRNTSLFQGEINWSTVVDESYWLITLGGITANGKDVDLGGTNKVAVDTGTTLIGAPDAVVKQIYSQIANSNEMASGYYTFPCSERDLSATMHFGNQEYTMTVDNLIAGTTDSSGTTCLGTFFSIGSTSKDELQYILGDAFLINVYSIFSNAGSSPQVGFAPLAAGLGSTTSSKTVSQVVTANGASSYNAPVALLCIASMVVGTIILA